MGEKTNLEKSKLHSSLSNTAYDRDRLLVEKTQLMTNNEFDKARLVDENIHLHTLLTAPYVPGRSYLDYKLENISPIKNMKSSGNKLDDNKYMVDEGESKIEKSEFNLSRQLDELKERINH